MSDQRRRRWADIVYMLHTCFVFTWYLISILWLYLYQCYLLSSAQSSLRIVWISLTISDNTFWVVLTIWRSAFKTTQQNITTNIICANLTLCKIIVKPLYSFCHSRHSSLCFYLKKNRLNHDVALNSDAVIGYFIHVYVKIYCRKN